MPHFDYQRRDLFLFLSGLTFLVLVFLLFPQFHPARLGDETWLNRHSVEQEARLLLDQLGFENHQLASKPAYYFRSTFLDSLQKQGLEAPKAHTSYWAIRLEHPDSRMSDLSYFEQTEAQRSVMFLDRSGKLTGFQNVEKRLPVSDSDPAWVRQVADSADSSQIEVLVRSLLQNTGWANQELTFIKQEPVSYDEITAQRVEFLASTPVSGVTVRITTDISPTGQLLNLGSEFLYGGESATDSDDIFLVGIRGGLIILFLIFLLYLLYLRVKEKVIDVRSSIILAVVIALLFPLSNLSSIYALVVYEGIHLAFTDYLILFINIGLVTAIVSIGYFIVSAIGESVSRQHWSDKLRTLDYLRMGAFYSRPVGWLMVRSVFYSWILLGILTLGVAFLPGVFFKLPVQLVSHQYYLGFISKPLQDAIVLYIILQAVFMIVLTLVYTKFKSRILVVVGAALIYAVFNVTFIPVGPLPMQILMNLVLGGILGWMYVRWDFLTVVLSQFLFVIGIQAMQGYVLPESSEVWLFAFYAGFSLVILIVGTMAALQGREPSQIQRYEPDYIEDLAMEERMKQELTIAKEVQASFLPVSLPQFNGADIYARCLSAYETGGDYFDFFELDRKRLGVMIGDVSGKGIQAAFFMTFIKGVLHALTTAEFSTKEVLSRANDLFIKHAGKGSFITMIYGILDLAKMEFRFTRAGHNPLLIYRYESGQIEEFRSEGLGIGIRPSRDFDPRNQEITVPITSGDLLILYTDGIVEAMNAQSEQFGEDALKKTLTSLHQETSREITARIFESVEAFAGKEKQHDDMTMVIIRVP